MFNEARDVVVSVNGEIYNHVALREKYCDGQKFRTASDCECIGHLYERRGVDFIPELDGDFAFILWDAKKKTYLVARDPLGVDSLYWGKGADGSMWFASELKAIQDQVIELHWFPPGHYYTPETGFVCYFKPKWAEPDFLPDTPVDYTRLR